jgi:hypothetical protein
VAALHQHAMPSLALSLEACCAVNVGARHVDRLATGQPDRAVAAVSAGDGEAEICHTVRNQNLRRW